MSDQNTTVAQAWRQIFVSLDTLALAHENAGTSFTGPVSSVRAAIRPLPPTAPVLSLCHRMVARVCLSDHGGCTVDISVSEQRTRVHCFSLRPRWLGCLRHWRT
jgi:hypothetical protein